MSKETVEKLIDLANRTAHADMEAEKLWLQLLEKGGFAVNPHLMKGVMNIGFAADCLKSAQRNFIEAIKSLDKEY